MSIAAAPQLSPEEAVRRVAQAREALVSEVHKVIIGQDEMIEQMLICCLLYTSPSPRDS